MADTSILAWPAIWQPAERAKFEEGITRIGLADQSSLDCVIKGFGYWLTWAEANGQPRKPCEESLRRYGGELLTRMKGLSAATYLMQIKKACKIIWPDGDWRWLDRWCSELWGKHVPPRKSRVSPSQSASRRCGVPFREWPVEKQKAWLAATAPLSSELSLRLRYGRGARSRPNSPKHNNKEPHDWHKDTKDTVIKGYGLFLAFCQRVGIPDEVTPDAIVEWVDDMDRQNLARRTTETYVAGVLATVTKVFEPEKDWAWLAKDVSDLASERMPKRNKNQRFVELKLIWHAARKLMDRAERDPGLRRSACDFRAGFMLAILVFHPLRVRNLAQMLVGENLILDEGGVPVRLEFQETKTGPRAWDFAPKLVPFWQRWWNWYRTFFAGSETSQAVWPGLAGNPITPRVLRAHLFRVTKNIFGKSLNPHLFRDILARTLTERGDPEAARHLLGHKDLKALTPYIQFADSEKAARCVRELINRSARRATK